MRHHYDAGVIIVTPGTNMKNFKYCAILLNMVHTGGLCGILVFTAPLILISKRFKSKQLYNEQCFVCPNCTSSNKIVTFGCLIDIENACKLYNTPSYLFLGSYLEPRSLMSCFANGNILSIPSRFIRKCKMNTQNFCLFVTFVSAVMLGDI